MIFDLWDVDAKASVRPLRSSFKQCFRPCWPTGSNYDFTFKEVDAYVLSVDKSGSKLKPGSPGTGTSMPELCWALIFPLGAPVINETGLDGAYDFKLDRSQETTGAAAPVLNGRERSGALITAVREQFGLKREGVLLLTVTRHRNSSCLINLEAEDAVGSHWRQHVLAVIQHFVDLDAVQSPLKAGDGQVQSLGAATAAR